MKQGKIGSAAPAFSSAELKRAMLVARLEALAEAATIAEADCTPGYGQRAPAIADQIEWLAEVQRRHIAERIREVMVIATQDEESA